MNPPFISPANQRLLDLNLKRRADFLRKPSLIYPWLRKCSVNILLVTDGGLDFGVGDFGLSTLVSILQNEAPTRAKFNLTLAHLRSDVPDSAVMAGAPGIVRSIKGFVFDDPSHFTPQAFHQIWMFGIETFFRRPSYATRNANPARYPAGSLGDEELKILNTFMRNGGGVFGTGDHGALGRGLCGSIPRVRSMRHWDSFPTADLAVDQVSMNGPLRNDTNQVGNDPGSQFDDQSDDIPQTIEPRLYSSRISPFTRARYPHPLLCGNQGIINVLPDHPHEGECRVPADLNLKFDLDGTDEYPHATGGGPRIAPEVIATSRVPAGNDAAGSKMPTVAHSFGAISTYDGHLAGIGRVVCDATWHHFVNVNLVGTFFDSPTVDPRKHTGFLSTPAGLAALDKIKNYYTNIAIWLAPTPVHACFHRKIWWHTIFVDRVMEAALVDPEIPIDRIPVDVFYTIGTHARDAFANRATQCQSLIWIFDWIRPLIPELFPWVNPWEQPHHFEKNQLPTLPLIDPWPLIHVALGAAIVTLRQEIPYPPEKLTEEHEERAKSALRKGATLGLELGQKEFSTTLNLLSRSLTAR